MPNTQRLGRCLFIGSTKFEMPSPAALRPGSSSASSSSLWPVVLRGNPRHPSQPWERAGGREPTQERRVRAWGLVNSCSYRCIPFIWDISRRALTQAHVRIASQASSTRAQIKSHAASPWAPAIHPPLPLILPSILCVLLGRSGERKPESTPWYIPRQPACARTERARRSLDGLASWAAAPNREPGALSHASMTWMPCPPHPLSFPTARPPLPYRQWLVAASSTVQNSASTQTGVPVPMMPMAAFVFLVRYY